METMPKELLQAGLAGIIMGLVMYFVIRPIVDGMLKQLDKSNQHLEAASKEITAQREERQQNCLRHQAHDEENLRVLKQLGESMDALVRRAKE